jgi:competence protein ComEA
MSAYTDGYKNWFGYSRRERRSAFILICIILCILILRYTLPERSSGIEYTRFSIPADYNIVYGQYLFFFDPNTLSSDSLLMLGYTSKEANTIIHYRNSGGKFFKPSDISKMYGIDSALTRKLIPYVRIKESADYKIISLRYSSQKKWKRLDLNSCDSISLDSLPGIGPVLSARIIKYRNLLGGFVSEDQLKEVYGLKPEVFDIIKDRIYVNLLIIRKIRINDAGFNEMIHHPYFKKDEVNAILKYRELSGNLNSISDIIDNKLMSAERAKKIDPYLGYGDKL